MLIPKFSLLKAPLLLVFVVLIILGCSHKPTAMSSQQKQQAEREVRLAFSQLVAAYHALDTAKYFSFFYQEKFIGLSEVGTNWNSFAPLKQGIEAGFSAIAHVEQLTFPNVKVSVIDPNTAILVNEFQQIARLHSGDVIEFAGGGTQVWVKHSGSWKLVSISASAKPKTKEK